MSSDDASMRTAAEVATAAGEEEEASGGGARDVALSPAPLAIPTSDAALVARLLALRGALDAVALASSSVVTRVEGIGALVDTLAARFASPDARPLPSAVVADLIAVVHASVSHAAVVTPLPVDEADPGSGAVVAVSALLAHPSDRAVVVGALALLSRCLKKDARVAAAAVEAGGILAVLAAMRAHDNVYEAFGHGCSVVCALARVDALAVQLGEAGALDMVALTMARHPWRSDVQSFGCKTVVLLCQSTHPNRSRACTAGMPAIIVAALRTHEHDASLVEAAAFALSTLTTNQNASQSDAECEAVYAAGASPALLAVMRTHAADARVQMRACGALANLWAGTESAARCAAAAAAGAVNLLVAAMRTHAGDAGVAQFVGVTLICLCVDDNECRASAVRSGAIEAHIDLLRMHGGMDANRNRLLLLETLLDTDDRASLVRAGIAGAVPFVLDAVRLAAGKPEPLQSSLDLLSRLLLTPATRAAAVHGGVYAAAVAALRAHPAEWKLLHAACGVIARATITNPGSAVHAGAAGAVRAVMDTIRAHPALEGLQGAAWDALRTLISETRNAEEAAAAGAVEAGAAALRAHGSNDRFAFVALDALMGMTSKCREARVRARAAGGLADALVPVLRAHRHVVNVAYMGCVVLSYLAVKDEDEGGDLVAERLAAAGVLEVMPLVLSALAQAAPDSSQDCSLQDVRVEILQLVAAVIVGDGARAARAVRAGMQRALAAPEMRALKRDADPELAAVFAKVRAALDNAPVEAAPSNGIVCALPGCGGTHGLKRCAGCSERYCCGEHQRADWPRHKTACRTAAAAARERANS